jgi:hypothetical protein
MKIKLVALAFLLFLVGSNAFAINTYYLPQVAIGSYGDGSFRTTFVLFNNRSTNASVTLKLVNDDGTPMSVTIPELGTGSTFSFLLTQASTQIFQTDNSGNARAGAAIITSDSEIGVSGLFTIYDKDGKFLTEAGVGSSTPLNNFILPVQVTSIYNTGLALYNPQKTDSSITATLTNIDGTVSGTNTFTLAAGQHMGKYVGGDLFKTVSNFQGTLTIQSSVAVSALTLRQISTPLTYTSTPVVPTASTQKTFNLAQVVNGTSADTGYKTAFMLFNFSTSSANITLALAKDTGTPFSVVIPGQGTGTQSTFTITLGAGKSLFLQTDGTGELAQGAAVITSTVPIGVASVFTQYNNGNFATEAGVQDSPPYTDVTLPIDSSSDADTGIALFNPGSAPVSITPRFLDVDGISTPATAAITIPANGHYAGYFGNLFPGLGIIQGSLAISSSTPVSALTMRLNNSPYSMTSLPVVQGVVAGFVYPTSGPNGTRTGIIVPNATVSGDTTLNKSIQWGLKIAATITGFPASGAGLSQVQAISASGKTYKPVTNSASSNLYVAPGVYVIRVIGWTGTSGSANGVWMTYTSPDVVTVTADTTAAITVPTPTFYTISGTIAGIDTISSASSSQLVFISTDNPSVQYTIYTPQTNGSFTQQMPAGTYVAGLQAKGFGSATGTMNLGSFNIGTFTVSGDATVNLALVDTAALSGTISFAGATPSAFTLRASDAAGPSIDTTTNNYAPGIITSTWASPSSGFTGAYDMQMLKSHTYNLSLQYSSYAGSATTVAAGTVFYTPTSNAVTVNSNSQFNFANIPVISDVVTLSGKLTGSDGTSPIVQAAVTAVSNTITGAANSVYRASTTTASDGTWSLKVPKGTYRVYLPAYGTPFVIP